MSVTPEAPGDKLAAWREYERRKAEWIEHIGYLPDSEARRITKELGL